VLHGVVAHVDQRLHLRGPAADLVSVHRVGVVDLEVLPKQVRVDGGVVEAHERVPLAIQLRLREVACPSRSSVNVRSWWSALRMARIVCATVNTALAMQRAESVACHPLRREVRTDHAERRRQADDRQADAGVYSTLRGSRR
jgi:hypothetical protein